MFLTILTKLGSVVPAFNVRSQETGASRSEFKASMVCAHSEFQASKGYKVSACLNKRKKKQNILIDNR